MASRELLRNANVQDSCTKEKRLRLLAKRAGDLSVEAYLGGNRERAKHFLKKMKCILWLVWVGVQGE